MHHKLQQLIKGCVGLADIGGQLKGLAICTSGRICISDGKNGPDKPTGTKWKLMLFSFIFSMQLNAMNSIQQMGVAQQIPY